MSYQVIARKWRPPTFTQLIGQDHVSQTLQNALKEDRLPHALLLTGPRGTGKTSSARILAKSLRCTQLQGVVPCNTCDDCKDINNSSHMDVIEIDGASNNGVDSIRELRETVGYMPSSGRKKIYIIDEIHMLSTSAFNALLKTLEEPPEHIVFIMATTEAHKIPHTILSRCQRFDFHRVSISDIVTSLAEICQKEGVVFEEEALWLIARQADGSMRDSQSLLDQVITFSGQNLTYHKVVEALSLTDRQVLLRTLEALVRREISLMLETVASVVTSGVDPKVFVQELLEEIRHLLVTKLSPERCASMIDLPSTEIEQLKVLAAKLSVEDIHQLFDMGLKGANDISRAMDPHLVLEILMLRMVAAPSMERKVVSAPLVESRSSNQGPPQSSPLQSALPLEADSPKVGPPQPVSAPEVGPSQSTSSQSAPPEVDTASRSQKWEEFVSHVKKVNPSVAAQLEHVYLGKMTHKTIVIGVPQRVKFLYDKLTSDSFKKKLYNYIQTFWGKRLEVFIEMETMGGCAAPSSPQKAHAMEQQRAQAKVEEERQVLQKKVAAHPLVKSAQSLFKSTSLTVTKSAGNLGKGNIESAGSLKNTESLTRTSLENRVRATDTKESL